MNKGNQNTGAKKLYCILCNIAYQTNHFTQQEKVVFFVKLV